jgi:hypothetical protein
MRSGCRQSGLWLQAQNAREEEMRILFRAAGVAAVFLLSSPASSGDFEVYPGARIDGKATRAATEAAEKLQSGMTGSVYTTNDSFEKVAAFYKGIATEYMFPRASGTSGKPKKRGSYELWEAYFIFDGAKDLAASKLWVKVQRPAFGLYKEDLETGQVRDVTVIMMNKKS